MEFSIPVSEFYGVRLDGSAVYVDVTPDAYTDLFSSDSAPEDTEGMAEIIDSLRKQLAQMTNNYEAQVAVTDAWAAKYTTLRDSVADVVREG